MSGQHEIHTPPADGHSSGAMLLSMLKQAGKGQHQQQGMGVQAQQGPSHAATAAVNGTSSLEQYAGRRGSATADLFTQLGTGQQPTDPVQPWQLWGSTSTSQQQPSSFPSLFSDATSQQQQPVQQQKAPVGLQRLFSGGGLGPTAGQPAVHQAAPPAAAAPSNPLDLNQQWQQQMQAQPLFSGLVDPKSADRGQPQQSAHPVPAGLNLGVAADPAASAAHGVARNSKGPPPGFPGSMPQQSLQHQQQPVQQQPYQPLQQQQPAQLHAAQLFGGHSQLPRVHWQQQQQQERLASLFGAQGPLLQQDAGRTLLPQQQQQQQPLVGTLGQPSQLQLLTQQREQQQHLQQAPGHSTPGFSGFGGPDIQPGGNLAALMAGLHLQQQQQQGLQHPLGLQHLHQHSALNAFQQFQHQQQQQQRQPHSPEDLLKQEQFQMLLSKLHPAEAELARSAGAVTATAAVAAAGAAAAASVAVAPAMNGYPSATANQQQRQQAAVDSMTGISIPQPRHPPSSAAAAAVAAHITGGPASARSSITGSPGGLTLLDQLSSSAPAGHGFMRPGAHGSAAGQQRTTPHQPPAIRQDMQQLNQHLLLVAEQLAPTAAQRQRQQVAWESVSGLLQHLWPQGEVHLFGSAANGLDIGNNNDLDVCLEVEGVDETREARGDVITELGEQLEAAGMMNVFAIPKARMPVVKFEHPHTGFKVDITVNNRLAVVNTKLLRDYASLDPRLRQLVLLVKHWAKRRRCNEAYVGTLSSYAYVLLCISHLQARSPPVLPVLQELKPFTHHRTIGNWCCDYNDDIKALSGFGSANSESVAQLLTSFFFYWAHQHDYRRAVITIRMSTVLTKAMKGWTTRVGMERHLLCIEDPFELSHDLGRTVHADGCDKLRHEFRRAWDICHHSSGPQQLITELFAEAPAPPPAVAPVAAPAAADGVVGKS